MNAILVRVSATLVAGAAMAAAASSLQPPATRAAQPSGWIVFASARDGDAEIYRSRPDGSERTQITSNEAQDQSPACSPDGKRIAFVSDRDGATGIYVADIDGGACTRIRECKDAHSRITWSPDGRHIAFDTNMEIHIASVDGGESKRIISEAMAPAWSPDGKTIAFNRGQLPHVYLMDADGQNVRPLLKEGGAMLPDLAPIWSPDGATILYTTVTGVRGETMTYAIRTVAADGAGVKTIRGVDQGMAVAWSPDGTQILYASETKGDGGLRILTMADSTIHTLTDELVGPWASWCK